MKKLVVCAAMLLLITFVVAPAPSPLSPDEAGWVSLFNGHDFDGWYTFLPTSGKNKDPKSIFKVEKGMIHVFDIPLTNEKQDFGYLATNQELSNCRIRAEFRFGEKRFVPRLEEKRDSGLLYYFVGPDKVWPRSLESQIQETDVGDLWILDGPTITTKIEIAGYPMYSTGPPLTKNRGRIIKSGDFEERGNWNTVEVILEGDKVTHLVNGRIVMKAWDLKQPDPQDSTKLVPLDRGRVALQAEGAEIWFRNVRMKRLN
jgi:hypothetical protein